MREEGIKDNENRLTVYQYALLAQWCYEPSSQLDLLDRPPLMLRGSVM